MYAFVGYQNDQNEITGLQISMTPRRNDENTPEAMRGTSNMNNRIEDIGFWINRWPLTEDPNFSVSSAFRNFINYKLHFYGTSRWTWNDEIKDIYHLAKESDKPEPALESYCDMIDALTKTRTDFGLFLMGKKLYIVKSTRSLGYFMTKGLPVSKLTSDPTPYSLWRKILFNIFPYPGDYKIETL